jgi:superoxide dismutase, Fe-Mn family
LSLDVTAQGDLAMLCLSRRRFLHAAGTTAALSLPGVSLLAAEEGPAFNLPPLPYAFDALEPHIDAKTMEIHHDRHHKAYVDNLNAALAKYPDVAKKTTVELLKNIKFVPEEVRQAVVNNGGGNANHTLFWEIMGPRAGGEPTGQLAKDIKQVPEDVRQAVVNNGGGHVNHTLFWEIMGPKAGGEPKGPLAQAIDAKFGSFTKFQDALGDAAVKRFGSGWAWLAAGDKGALEVFSTANQDSPYLQGKTPLLGLDVWEHAYYLKYQNKRADYVKAWWNVVKWAKVDELYAEALKKGA